MRLQVLSIPCVESIFKSVGWKNDTIIYNPSCDNYAYSGIVLLLINNDDTRDFYINDNVIVVDNNMDIKRLIIDVGNNGGNSEMDAGDISVKVYVKGSDTALRYIYLKIPETRWR